MWYNVHDLRCNWSKLSAFPKFTLKNKWVGRSSLAQRKGNRNATCILTETLIDVGLNREALIQRTRPIIMVYDVVIS